MNDKLKASIERKKKILNKNEIVRKNENSTLRDKKGKN